MAVEQAFHKLGSVEDYESVKAQGLKPSAPAEIHWLGEGVYFFLDPNGYDWAKKWPMNDYHPRTNSPAGIVATEITTDHALDFRDDDIRNKTREIVNKLKLRLHFNKLPHTDGAAFALLFKEGIFKKAVNFVPTAIVANFDKQYKQYRIEGSAVFITEDVMKVGKTAQIQACVIDLKTIGVLKLLKAVTD